VCRMLFGSKRMITDTKTAGLRYRAVVPTREAWDENRFSYCLLYAADTHQLTKSYLVVE